MLRNMVSSLIKHEAVVTTWHKAKEAQRVAEKLISHGKRGTPASLIRARKVLFDDGDQVLVQPTDAERSVRGKLSPSSADDAAAAEETRQRERALVHKVFTTLASRYADRQGGYTRVLQLPNRVGDKARQAILTLVDGQRDVRFDLTATTIARARIQDRPLTQLTLENAVKVTKYRPDGKAELDAAVDKEESRLRRALKGLSLAAPDTQETTNNTEAR